MDEKTRLATELRDKIASIKKYSNTTSFSLVFEAAADILGLLSYLGSVEAELEVAYRRVVIKAKEAGESMAAADSIGKASDEYLQFRKFSILLENGHEAIMLLKKFKDALENEQKRN